jgi:AcrR family transcriptional regulator
VREDDPRRAELLRIARDVFSERGFEQAKMRDIAARMGLLGGSLYHYVDSKQALLGEVMRAVQVQGGDLMQGVAARPGTPPDKLRALLERHVAVVARDPRGVTLVFTEQRRLTAEQRALITGGLREYRRGVEQLVRQGQQDGSLRSGPDARLATMAILGATNWTARWLRTDGPLPPDQVGAQLATLLLDGLTADGTRPADASLRPPPALLEADPGGRRAQIMAAAAELFNRQGFAVTSMADLAVRIGIGKASLYHYFRTKEDLLFAVLEGTQQVAKQQIDALAAADAPAVDRLAAVIRCHVRYVAGTLDATSVALHAYGSLSPEHRATMSAADQEYIGVFRGLVDAVQDEGDGRTGLDPGVATRGILGAGNWLYRWYRPTGEAGADQIADLLADVLLRGLRPRAGT